MANVRIKELEVTHGNVTVRVIAQPNDDTYRVDYRRNNGPDQIIWDLSYEKAIEAATEIAAVINDELTARNQAMWSASNRINGARERAQGPRPRSQ